MGQKNSVHGVDRRRSGGLAERTRGSSVGRVAIADARLCDGRFRIVAVASMYGSNVGYVKVTRCGNCISKVV